MAVAQATVARAKRTDPRVVLVALGMEHDDLGNVLRALCPHPKHNDKHPSWEIDADPESEWYGHHRCWSCGWRDDMIELVCVARSERFDTAVRWLIGLGVGDTRVSRSGIARLHRPKHAAIEVLSDAEPIWDVPHGRVWCRHAGIPEWQARRHGLLWRAGRAVFVVRDRSGRIRDYEERGGGSGPKAVSAKGGEHAYPFGAHALDDSHDTVILVEGFFELLRLERMGYIGCVLALRGSALHAAAERLLDHVARVVVLPDGDDAGWKLWMQCRKQLRFARSGRRRDVLLAALPCDGPLCPQRCDRDADACTADVLVEKAIVGASCFSVPACQN